MLVRRTDRIILLIKFKMTKCFKIQIMFQFFYMLQDEQKAEDELAKKRAAFLLKQQKKAEDARLRKQQLEAESELKRDEAR